MWSRLISWFRARWAWGKGYCPHCHRKFYGAQDLYNYDCEVCEGRIDDLAIWSNWRRWKQKPPDPHVKVLHSHKAKALWKNTAAQEAVIEKE